MELELIYVCPYCYSKYNSNTNLNCPKCEIPTIQIDESLVDSMIELWKKGVQTYSCCDGINSRHKPHVAFHYDHKVLNILKMLVFKNDLLKKYAHDVAINIICINDDYMIYLHSNNQFDFPSYLKLLSQEWI